MAFYDYNGTIMIDEQVARNDIRRLQNALPNLQAAKAALDRLIEEGSNTQGDTGNAVLEKASELQEKIVKLIQSIQETQGYIERTIVHYQEIDRQVKAAIQAVAMMGE